MKPVVFAGVFGLLVLGGSAQAREVCETYPDMPRGCYEVPDESGAADSRDDDDRVLQRNQRPSPEEAAEDKRIDAAWAQDELGWNAYDRKAYSEALAYFQGAVALAPEVAKFSKAISIARSAIAITAGNEALARGDNAEGLAQLESGYAYYPTNSLRDDITRLKGAIAADEARERARAQTSAAVSNKTNALISSAATAPPAPVAGLQFMAPEPGLKDSVADKAADQKNATGSCLFGKCGPSNPGLQGVTSAEPGTNTKAIDQLKAMTDTSNQGANALTPEQAATQAGSTPTNGGGNPGAVIPVKVETPRTDAPYPPALAAALAKDPAYQKLGEERARAVKDADDAKKQLDALAERQKTAPAPERANIQVQMSAVTQKLDTATSEIRTADIQRDQIKTTYVDKITILPAKKSAAAVPAPVTAAKSGTP